MTRKLQQEIPISTPVRDVLFPSSSSFHVFLSCTARGPFCGGATQIGRGKWIQQLEEEGLHTIEKRPEVER
jgi:hypothetical protein